MTAVNDDLLDPEIVQNPAPYYRLLREHHPCHWNERWRGWVLSRYEDVYNALHSSQMLADRITPYFQTRLSEDERRHFALTYEVLHSFVVFRDPPDHTHLRRIFARSKRSFARTRRSVCRRSQRLPRAGKRCSSCGSMADSGPRNLGACTAS